MKRVATLVGGLVVVSGTLAGCGDDGGGAVSINSSWRLWSMSAESFTTHTLSGADGYDDNEIECSNDGVNISIRMLHSAQIIDENDDGLPDVPSGNPGEIEIQARVGDPNTCFVQARERALGTNPPTAPTYTDRCGVNGGCQINLTANGGAIMGTLTCSEMIQASGGPAKILASGDRNVPMQINLENCDT